jgi:hypothetical protein
LWFAVVTTVSQALAIAQETLQPPDCQPSVRIQLSHQITAAAKSTPAGMFLSKLVIKVGHVAAAGGQHPIDFWPC